MDRIDMYVTVPRPAAREMVSCAGKKNTGHIRDEVGRAITFRAERKGCHEESRKAESLRDYLVHNGFTDDSVHMLSSAAESLLLSGRSMTKVSTIARTIADLDARHQVDVSHLAEALSYRRVQEI